MRHRFKLLGFVGVLICLAVFLSFRIGREFFPQVDAGQITVYLRCPSNLRLDASEKRVAQVEDLIRQNIPREELDMIVSEMGVDPDWSSAYTDNSGQQDAIIRIQLSEERKFSARSMRSSCATPSRRIAALSDLRVSFNTGGMVSTALNNGAASPIDIQIEGGKQEEHPPSGPRGAQPRAQHPGGRRRPRAAAAQRSLSRHRRRSRRRPSASGLSPKEVIEQAVAALNSSISIDRNFWIDVKTGNQYFVAVQYPENPAMKLDDLLNIEATGAKQSTPVKLSSLAQFPPRLRRRRNQPRRLDAGLQRPAQHRGPRHCRRGDRRGEGHQGHSQHPSRRHVHHVQGRVRADERIVLEPASTGWSWPRCWSTCCRWRCSARGSAR